MRCCNPMSVLVLLVCAMQAAGFVVDVTSKHVHVQQRSSSTTLNVFGKKKKPDEDLSYIESRDMTREEMFELNKKNEEIMNAELAGMTIFSLVLSIPMLYLVWVGFFSETSEIAGEL